MDVRLWAEVGTHSVVAPVKLAEVPASSYNVHGCKYIECYNLPGTRTNLPSGTFELHLIGWVVSQFATIHSEVQNLLRLLLNKQNTNRFVVYSFVWFVSNTEILEHVYTMEYEILQIQEAISIEGNNDILWIQDQHVKQKLKQLLLKAEKKKTVIRSKEINRLSYNLAGTMYRERVKRNGERNMHGEIGLLAATIKHVQEGSVSCRGERWWNMGLKAIANERLAVLLLLGGTGSFDDGFPNLFINNAQDIRGQHVAFLASFSSPAVIFEQLSVIFALPRLFVASFTLVLPFFPTGSFERMEEEGDVATAFTMARILSNIPVSRGGPTSLVIYDIHALQERFYFGDHVLPLFEIGMPLLKRRLYQLPDAVNVVIAFPNDGA
ncbi:ribose-phosphate pyrophosphokinase 4 [Tanacetum coccineum]